jgi:hypothetical protein
MLRFPALAQILFACTLAACGGSSDSSSNGSDTGTPSDGALDTKVPSETGADTTSDAPVDSSADAVPDAMSETTSETASETAGEAGSGAVGAGCTDGSQCSTDFCITDAKFTGGYCSEPIPECPAPGGGPDPCPTGSSCLNLSITGGTGSGDACARNCSVDGDCRTGEGYKCCPISTALHVCIPTSMCLP